MRITEDHTRLAAMSWLGTAIASHYRRRTREEGSSVYHVARQMRKQGFPLAVALTALAPVCAPHPINRRVAP
jgi:hypothetical protein